MITDHMREIFAAARRRARMNAAPLEPSAMTEAPRCRPVGIIETADEGSETAETMEFGLPPGVCADDLMLERVVLDDGETLAGQAFERIRSAGK